MPEPVLLAERLTYRYPATGRPALDELTLAIEPGEFVVLAGRSGSGKTTLLRAACGLVPHFHGGEVAGRIEVAGLDLRSHGPGELASAVGFVSQEPETQVVSTTVRAELELPLELRGEPSAGRARAVEEAALALAIPHLLERATDTLSGGELQRVALAAALVSRPRLVLLDEPTSQLDPVAGDELVSLLRRLNEEWGTAVVLCEHRLERCLASGDRALALADGRIAFDGSPEGFLDWALAADPALATPAARLFDLAGLRPLPVSVKKARSLLSERGLLPDAERSPAASPGETGSVTDEVPRGRPPGASDGWMLEVRDLWVELDRGDALCEVLHGVDLRVAGGERVALMGRNGAGKSTLLRACAGLVQPVRGEARTPRGCALLTQDPSSFLVRERVSDELPGPDGRRALERVGLDWAAERDPRDLSGGERQRLALAIAMAGREGPGLVCLDEPTRGMDRARKEELAAWLAALTERGAAAVVATHDVEFAATFAERTVLLGAGERIADGPASEVLSGGWYFATEVSRALGAEGAITPEVGARMLGSPTLAGEGGTG